YALQAAGADPGTTPLRTVEELADSYLAALRKVQPHGPYALGGWSFGGFVAFEMARRLRASGEEVAQPVLLDTTALTQGRRHRHQDRTNGWSAMTDGPLQVIDVPGDHLTIMEEPYVEHMARTVAELISSGPAGSPEENWRHVK